MKIQWTNVSGGSFATAGDWSLGTVPGPSDIAVLPLLTGAPYTVTVGSNETVLGINTASNATLDVAGGSTQFSDFAGTAGGANLGTVKIENGDFLFITDGSFDNPGIISLNSTGFTTEFDGASLLLGHGVVTMSDNVANNTLVHNELTIGTNVDNTISGSGTVTLNLNEKSGIIDSNGTDGLYVVSPNALLQNTGLLEATGAGGLYLEFTIDDSSGGTILANNGPVFLGAVVIGGVSVPGTATIIGGLLESQGTGSIEVPTDGYAELNGSGGKTVTIEGDISVADNAQLGVLGVIDNTGQIQLNGSGQGADLYFGLASSAVGDTTLEGDGSIDLVSSAELLPNAKATQTRAPIVTNVNNTIFGTGGIDNVTFVNEVDGVVNATGSLGFGNASVTNAGLLEATGSNAFFGAGNSTITNTATGKMEAGAGARFLFQHATIVGGTLSGPIELSGNGNPLTEFTTFDGSGTPLAIQGSLTGIGFIAAPAFKGVIDNTGTITNSVIEVEAAKTNKVTFAGSGSVVLKPGGSGISTASPTLPAVQLNNSNHISGAGIIGSPNLIFDNAAGGIVEANQTKPIVVDTGAHTVINAGTLQADAGSALLVESALSNSGTLNADNGFISLSGAVTGAGTAVLSGTAQVEFAAASSNNTKFTASSGETLFLDDSVKYTGTVFGFTGTDHLDLADVAFATATESFSKGVLTVNDHHGHVANIRFNGSYTLANFNLTGDGNGGTLITDPPAVAGGTPPASPGNHSPAPIDGIGAHNIALLGNYMASAFAAIAGGLSDRLGLQTQSGLLPMLAHPHV